MTRDEIVRHLTNEGGQALVPLAWWEPAWRALDDPGIRQVALWLTRQAGKSTFLAVAALVTLLTEAGAYIVLVAASEGQAQAIFHRKIRRPLERLLKALGVDRRELIITKRSIEIPARASKLEVLASEAATVPGRSVRLLLVDEARDVSDSVYLALAPALIGSPGSKVLIASTAGRPSGWFYELVKAPLPETFVYAGGSDNLNPYADRGMWGFLRKQFTLLSPAAARRELENEFAEDADAFLPAGLIEAAVDDTLGERPSSPLPAFSFLDLSRKADLTSLVVVLRTASRRPEVVDHLEVASIRVWDPKRSPTGQTDFAEVRAALGMLPQRFPGLQKLLVDEGAEAGSVLPFCKAHAQLTMVTEGFIGSADSNMKLWGALAARLHERTLSIPHHPRLLEELRGLRQEAFSFGAKWRVVDGSRKFHRDVSLALAGAIYAAGEPGPMLSGSIADLVILGRRGESTERFVSGFDKFTEPPSIYDELGPPSEY